MAPRAFRPCSTAMVVAAALCALAFAAVPTAAAPTAVFVYSAQNSALGRILVSASGRTLYHSTGEPKNVVRCTGACAADWTPLLVPAGARPIAGRGVQASLLGTVKRPEGTR